MRIGALETSPKCIDDTTHIPDGINQNISNRTPLGPHSGCCMKDYFGGGDEASLLPKR